MFAREKRETYRGIVQLVEYRSPKPRVVGSNPTAPAQIKYPSDHSDGYFFAPIDHERKRNFASSFEAKTSKATDRFREAKHFLALVPRYFRGTFICI